MVRITESLPQTGFERPSAEQLRRLRQIVLAAHPWLRDHDEQSFARSFTACGLMFRTEAPESSRYFHSFVESANDLLERLGMYPVDGVAFLAAAIGHADIPYRLADARRGVLLEVGLNEHSGIKCSNAWRGLLDGSRSLLAPLPPPDRLRNQIEADAARPSFYVEGANARFHRVGDDEPGALFR